MLDWLEHDLLLIVTRWEPASSDASFRRYFRVTTPDGRFIVMDAPPEKENISAFIKVAELLRASNVYVPFIYQMNLSEGFLLLEDLGSQCFLDLLDENSVETLYQSALNSLFQLQVNTVVEACGLPSYNETLLRRELAIFDDWFLQSFLNIEMPSQLQEQAHALLIHSALEQPRICVHRDFHSRNLMVLADDNSPGVIDFQDAVIGPITYDLVSLLRDCYIAWPEARIEQWLSAYYQRLLTAGLIDCDQKLFKRWFDFMGMQRHLKAIGIFARLDLRDGKPGYLKDIPRTMNYVNEVAQTYPELTEFGSFLKNRVFPRMVKIT